MPYLTVEATFITREALSAAQDNEMHMGDKLRFPDRYIGGATPTEAGLMAEKRRVLHLERRLVRLDRYFAGTLPAHQCRELEREMAGE